MATPPTTTAAPELFNPDADGLVGSVLIWPSHTLPNSKYLFCDGAAVSRTTYSLLFSRIGTEHGTGDGSTTFNLPNYTGRFPVGLNPADADFDNIGDTGGTKSVNTAAHTHSTPAHSHAVGTIQANVANNGTTASAAGITVGSPGNATMSGSTASDGSGTTGSGGGESLATLPPFNVTQFAIKVL